MPPPFALESNDIRLLLSAGFHRFELLLQLGQQASKFSWQSVAALEIVQCVDDLRKQLASFLPANGQIAQLFQTHRSLAGEAAKKVVAVALVFDHLWVTMDFFIVNLP